MDYEKAYKDALSRAKELKNKLEKQGEEQDYNPYKATIESIAAMVEKYANGDLRDFYDNIKVKCKDAMEYDNTWNKKQGEQNLIMAKSPQLGEQKSADKVEPKFKVGDIITNKKSKDTVKIVQILHDSYCYSGWNGAATVHSDFNISEQDDWELVEQNPAWSKEDEKYINDILAILGGSRGYRSNRQIEDWLKSLKPQSHWKPTDEQMEDLKYAINTVDKCCEDSLQSLYNELKKL